MYPAVEIGLTSEIWRRIFDSERDLTFDPSSANGGQLIADS